MAVFQAKAFQSVGSSGFSNAKKLADLTIKKNVDSKQKGYEEAIKILSQYQYSNNESEALDAQRLVQSYTNQFAKLKSAKSDINKTVGDYKISEDNAFYVTPTTQYRNDTMFDIPTVVSDTTAGLRQLMFEVLNTIKQRKMNGDSVAELQSYANGLHDRYRMMERLNNDLMNNNISQKQALNDYGVFIDASQSGNTHQVYGISVAPIGDLPSRLKQSDYKRIDSSTNFGGGDIPVYSRFSTNNNGVISAHVGDRTWLGDAKFPLAFDSTQSIDKNYKNTPGSLNFSDFAQKESTPIQPGKFFKGFTGIDSNGVPKETMFFTSKDNKIYTVDKNSQNLLSKDFKDAMHNAVGVGSNFAQNVLKDGNVKPIDVNPMVPQDSAARMLFPKQLPQQNQQSSFFNQNKPTSASNLAQSFFNNKNTPNKPDQAKGTSFSASDIIDKGNPFFRGTQFGDKKPFSKQ